MSTTEEYGWVPVTDPRIIKRLGKTAEEASELAEAASRLAKICNRILIQGLNEKDPKTGRENLKALEDEIADVRGQSHRCIKMLKLNEPAIQKRSDFKECKMEKWEESAGFYNLVSFDFKLWEQDHEQQKKDCGTNVAGPDPESHT